MEKLTLHIHNHNGKLFNEHFSHVALFSEEYKLHNVFDVFVFNSVFRDHRFLGRAQIVALRQLAFKYINDTLAFIEIGRPAHYLAQSIRLQNEAEAIGPDALIVHCVLQWTERELETLGIEMNAYFQTIKTKANENAH